VVFLITSPHPSPLPEGEGITKDTLPSAKIRAELYWERGRVGVIMKNIIGAYCGAPRRIWIAWWSFWRLTPILAAMFLAVSLTGCFFSGGVSTVSSKKYNGGIGYFSSTERNGQWEFDGAPPKIGEVTNRSIYRLMQKEAAYSILTSAKDYGLSEPYPERQRRVTAIREIGAVKENDQTRHYYEIEFEFAD
jgi:hypothetical protein